MTQKTLEILREEIDQIDDQIHDLIMARGRVVEHIGAVKRSQTPMIASPLLAVRPAREAAMFQRLLARHHGAFPAESLIHIWHELIGAFTQLQNQFSISVVARDNDPRDNDNSLLDLARDQFGTQTQLIAAANEEEALHLMQDGKTKLAVIAFPQNDRAQRLLWDHLSEENAPKIMMALPFIPVLTADAPRAIVLSYASPAPSMSDHSLLIAKLQQGVAHSRLLDAVNDCLRVEFGGDRIAAKILSVAADQRIMLRVNLFMDQTLTASLCQQLPDMMDRLDYIGSYPAMDMDIVQQALGKKDISNERA
ncbi:MAG: chorismate mutase [Alphaproteobacteria bacterium]